MIGVVDYSKDEEELGYKEITSIGVYEWSVEGTTEGNMIVPIEGSI